MGSLFSFSRHIDDCSHILQPMDVGCYGPFQRLYNAECHKLMSQISGAITRYNVCQIACYVYMRALSADNIQSAFRRSGIYPLNYKAVPSGKKNPAEVFCCDTSPDNQPAVEVKIPSIQAVEDSVPVLNMFEKREKNIIKIKSENTSKTIKTMSKIVAGKEITGEIIGKMNIIQIKSKNPALQNKFRSKER